MIDMLRDQIEALTRRMNEIEALLKEKGIVKPAQPPHDAKAPAAPAKK